MSLNSGPKQTVAEGGLVRNRNSTTDEKASRPPSPINQRKSPNPENAFTIAMAPKLFHMEKEQKIYEEQGMENYFRFHGRVTEPLSPGPAFSFVKALEAVNGRLRELYPDSKELFNVVLMTSKHPQLPIDTKLYLSDDETKVREAREKELPIDTKLYLSDDETKVREAREKELPIDTKLYLSDDETKVREAREKELPIDTKLYLSDDETKVREAREKGIAVATMCAPEEMTEVSQTQLRVAFDGDAVLFSDESERFFKDEGLEKFEEREQDFANQPMDTGPLTGFLEALVMLQKKFYAKCQRMDCPIRTYLVTSRGGGAGTRALNTLRGLGLDTDGAHFLAGAPKGPVLKSIQPHIFFDDQVRHVDSALKLGIVACHVPIA